MDVSVSGYTVCVLRIRVNLFSETFVIISSLGSLGRICLCPEFEFGTILYLLNRQHLTNNRCCLCSCGRGERKENNIGKTGRVSMP